MKTEYKILLGIGSVITFGLVLFGVIKFISKRKSGEVWDSASEEKIKTLHPQLRNKAREFLNKAERQGIMLRVTSAFRTYEQQDKLYAQGRTTSGSIVTNARGGYSNHNFGTAFDVVQIINGKADYDNADWDKIGQIGKSIGFKWGGDWQSFIDKPHFEMTFGNSLAEMRDKFESGQTNNGYIELT